ncbi:hypothetical protein GJU43_21925 [Flavobacterium sp. LC2016-23]|uniref:hypothetical protein n=1 Tax=Flavobacterium sp. LC2016-23 TaxID=2666330 RepID=UPI0012B08CF8|nr:hypothetical protein [Flavobacterium sp. LC2016-23]MRX41945.1 hypothetical protein [Flavobacterium sp. LC2016-23]
MNRKLKQIAKVVLCSFILIASGCASDNEFTQQEAKMNEAKNWFDKYDANGANYALFQNMQYEWNQASVTRSEDGTETIIVPVTELKKDQREFWEQKLYIYKSDEGRYSALLFEAYSNKDIKPESQSVEGGDFTGYMTVWDLKKGALRAAKFLNNQVVEEGVAAFSIDRNKTNKAPETGDCIYADFGEGCHNDGGDGTGNAIPLRPVIVTGPSTGTPVIYTPRGPVIGGTTPGGYTSPGGGGGGSTPSAPVKPAVNPCDKMKALTDVTKSGNMKPSIDWLKGKVMAPKNVVEHGVEVKKVMNPDETFRYEYTQLTSLNEFSVPLPTGLTFIGGAHSHPARGVAMFSFADVRFLRNAYDGASPIRKEDVFAMVIVKDNAGRINTYAIRVDDINALDTKVNEVWNDPKYNRNNPTDDKKFKSIHDDEAVVYDASNGALEETFLAQYASFGITLYKADDTLTKWDKLVIDKTTKKAIAVPCT